MIDLFFYILPFAFAGSILSFIFYFIYSLFIKGDV